MTKKQEDKLTMWSATDAVLTKYEENWQEITAFANAAVLFRNLREDVDPEAGKQQQDNKGTTFAKSVSRETLTKQIKQMALNIKAYAINTKEFELEQQFTFTPSHFERLRDNAIPVIARIIFLKAVDLRNELLDYGVSEEKLQLLKVTLGNYKAKNPEPRLKKGETKQATVNISVKLAEGAKQLGIMDDLLGNFDEKYPEFVSAFKNGRIVINHSLPKKRGKPTGEGGAKN